MTGTLTTVQFNRSQFTRCHTIGHAWIDYDDDHSFGPLTTNENVFFLKCERCGTARRDVFMSNGELSFRTYRYPDGYKYGRNETPTRSEFRVMMLAQRMDEARKARRRSS